MKNYRALDPLWPAVLSTIALAMGDFSELKTLSRSVALGKNALPTCKI